MKGLTSIEIQGFKSIGESQRIDFGKVTVFLGANGAGKSNLISFFKMLNFMTTDGLQQYVAKNGMANSILHFGSQKTKAISFKVDFSNKDWNNSYKADLAFGMPDSIFISGEQIIAHCNGKEKPFTHFLESVGRSESALKEAIRGDDAKSKTSKVIKNCLSSCRVFQFHDTSDSSRIRNSCYIDDSDYLKSDAGNLPAFLYAIRNNNAKYYDRIVDHVRVMVPQFQDFVLKPSSQNKRNILLNWIGERGNDYLLGPHQFSDGSLRYIALATLLLQPKETLPQVIILDEPELGLHPAAIASLAGLISIAKQNCQVILATQSPELANLFNAEDLVIVNYDKKKNTSIFKKLDVDSLKEWLKEYSISELWEKNILGGRP